MFYTGKDAAIFLTQTEFIDTAIIPLIPISFEKATIPHIASQADYVLSLVNSLENQFKGRVVAFPSFSYFDNQDKERLLEEWTSAIENSVFRHTFFVTSDTSWKMDHPQILWTASIPLDSMDSKMRMKIIEDQIRQLIPRIAEKWNT